MPRDWTPQEYMRVMACGTGCLCLIFIVAVTMILAASGRIQLDHAAVLTKGGASGAAALAVILVGLIQGSIFGLKKKAKT